MLPAKTLLPSKTTSGKLIDENLQFLNACAETIWHAGIVALVSNEQFMNAPPPIVNKLLKVMLESVLQYAKAFSSMCLTSGKLAEVIDSQYINEKREMYSSFGKYMSFKCLKFVQL